MLQQLRQLARNEQGGLGFNLIWVIFIILFLIPFFWDVGSIHYARRFAGIGADAASLAAAQEYARRLHFVPQHQGLFLGKCELGEFTPQQVVMRYRLEPAFTGAPGFGQGYASSYASQNRDDLKAYRSWPEYSGVQAPAGVPIPVIKVYVDTEREAHTAYAPIYRRIFNVPNKAQAVAYLRRWTVTPRPCPYNMTTYDFTFEWKIALDKAW
jgi:hypothetical protein